MKKEVIFLIFLIVSMPISYAEVIDIPWIASKDSEEGADPIEEGGGVKKFIYAGNNIVASIKGSSVDYYHRGVLSNRLTTDSNGDKENEFKSLPFGQKVVNSGVDHPFTGKEEDESSLYYFGARYYDDNLGRFTGVDPVEENHPYTYVRNNPLNLIDPNGEEIYGGQNYEIDYPWGDGTVMQFGTIGSNAPWYHLHEQLYVGAYNLASAVSNLGLTTLALPDVALASVMRDDLDREAFWMSTMVLAWQGRAMGAFMTDGSMMSKSHGIHSTRVNRAMMRAGHGFVGHDAGSRGKTTLGFKLIDEAAYYVNRYAPIRNFMGKRFRVPGRWFKSYHSDKTGHHLPESLMKAARAGELSPAQRQRYAAEATIDVIESTMTRSGKIYSEAAADYVQGPFSPVYNKAVELAGKDYVHSIIDDIPRLLAD